MPSEYHQIPLRVPEDLFKQIEDYLAELRAKSPGVEIHRTDAVRQLVIKGLATEKKGKK